MISKRGIAERVSNLVGTEWFLAFNVTWFLGWILLNVGLTPIAPFDPYPFPFLTFVVSLEAIVLSLFVLIAQNRTARLDSARDEADFQLDIQTEHEVTKLLHMMKRLHEHLGLAPEDGDPELDKMLHPTKIDELTQKQRTASSSQ